MNRFWTHLALGLTACAAFAQTPPRLDGIWQAMEGANWNVEPHAAAAGQVPQLGANAAIRPGLGVVEGGEIPYLPAAREKQKQNFANRLELDPEIKCYMPGVPRATYIGQPFQIVQSKDAILLSYQFAGAVRMVNMGAPTKAPVDQWMGWSNGRWEGNTLVVDVTGLNADTWLDRAGNHHSDQLHVVERYTPRGANMLWYEATLEDPQTYSRPWKIALPLYRRVEPGARLMEFKCAEFAEERLYGHLRKGAEKK